MSDQLEFACPSCGQAYRLSAAQLARYAGRTTNCRKCQQPFAFPAAEDLEPASAAAQAPAMPDAPRPRPADAAPPPQPAATPEYNPPPAAGQPLSYARPSSTGLRWNWSDFFAFRLMITVPVVKILFWVGVGFWVLMAGITAFSGIVAVVATGEFLALAVPLAMAVGMLTLGPILVRLYCEFIVVVFRINETLLEIHQKLGERE